MPSHNDLCAYEERYRLVYQAGARFWNEHQPHPRLIKCAAKLPQGATCIEFGCGEGFEARALAALGLRVTAIDLSATAIRKAQEETPEEIIVDYRVGDATDLRTVGGEHEQFDLAVDVHCLHMMSDQNDRCNYLAVVKRLLKPGGLFYVQDMLALDDVIPQGEAEARQIEELRAFQATHTGGDQTPRKIETPEGVREIMLPLCPAGKTQTLQEYIDELTGAGFAIKQAERGGSLQTGVAAIIIAVV
jgi:2-polyprenyl-3-methyl-5-hydroxy-6-metoxy-1,4-benzoquinol methylase